MKNILSIDVGGTKIASGLVNTKLQLSKIKVQPTDQKNLTKQLDGLIREYSGFDGIALGLPGQISSSGQVGKLPNIQSFHQPGLALLLEQKFLVPVVALNDAKAFALAESVLGAGRNDSLVVGITLGTGVGSGVVMNKQIYFGADGVAGEFGRFIMPDGRDFESHIKQAGNFKTADKASKLLQLLLGFVVLSFNPQRIVLGGGWAQIPRMQKVASQALSKLTFPTKTKISVSQLKFPGVLGAAIYALKK